MKRWLYRYCPWIAHTKTVCPLADINVFCFERELLQISANFSLIYLVVCRKFAWIIDKIVISNLIYHHVISVGQTDVRKRLPDIGNSLR